MNTTHIQIKSAYRLKTLRPNPLRLIALAFFILSNSILFSQSLSISPANDTVLCTNQTLPLHANVSTTVSGSGSQMFVGYNYSTIPINPGPTTGTNISVTDDAPSGAINIGFPFQFYGNTYNQLYVSPNGYISFVQPVFTYEPVTLPSCDSETPQSAIIACWQDFNPGTGGTVTYTTTGVAPNRRFIISWNNVPFFQTFTNPCPGLTSSFQIHLFETTNIIQIHIINKPPCNSLWGTGWVSGLVGSNSSPTCNCGYIPAGYNNVTGGMTNQAFQYTPASGTLNGVTANLVSLQWSVNGTNVGTLNNPNYTAFMTNTTATRTVVCTAVFSIPCIGNVTLKDTVVIRPRKYDAEFTVTSPICAGQETSLFTFIGLPTPTAAAVPTWNFDSGTAVPGTGYGPHDVSWATPGTKNVSLRINGGACAADTFTTTVDVVASPTSTFTATSQVCGAAPATITYTGNAPSTATFVWNFNGGTPTPASGIGPFSVTWATPGVKTITLEVHIGSCISAVTTQTVTVLPPPTSTFTSNPAAVCIGAATTLTYTGSAPASATYTWNFDGGTAVPATGQGPFSVSWNTSGTKNVTLVCNDNGCISNTTTVPVTVYAIPTANFTTPAAVCPNQNATITYTGSATAGATYNWNWNGGVVASGSGAGPYSVNWASAGTKTITLTVTQNGCVSTQVSNTLTVNPIPTSSFTVNPTGVCVGEQTTLTYTGTGGAGATYNWTYGTGTITPGGTSAGAQQVSWNASGNQNVGLTVTENGCVSTTTTQAVTIFPTPTATFTITPAVCPGVNATTAYTGTGTAAATYAWSFDSGNATSGGSASGPYTVNWNTSGTKNVSLVVTENGCSSQPLTHTVTVYQTPSSSFTALSPVCENSPSTVSYIGGAGATATYNWSFPGATPVSSSSGGPLNVTWATAGSYFLNLTVTENGCPSLPTQVQVVVNPIPTSTFTASTPVCLDGASTVSYTGTAPVNAIYNWNFNDGLPNTTVGPGPIDVEWNTTGVKTISLSVVSLGCQSLSSSQTITVLGLPTVNAGPDHEVCSGAVASIGSPGLPGHTYQWTPIVGLTDPTQPQGSIQLYNNSTSTQTYQFILTANDGQCLAADSMLFSVTAPPFVSFSVPPGQCLNGNSFSFEAQGDFTNTADFIWNFGANASIPSSSVVNPSNISFNTTGSQTISLQIDDSGCFSNLYTADVVVYPEPTADFYAEFTTGCLPLKVDFINLSTGPSNMIYSWNFGTGNPSASESPSFNYEEQGVYDVSLNVITSHGCSSSKDRKEYIVVNPVPKAGFELVQLEATVIEPSISFNSTATFADSVWYVISTGDTLYGIDQTYEFPDTAGIYNIKQYVGNEFGCQDSLDRNITITTGFRFYIPNSFTPNGDEVNDYFRPYGEGMQNFHIYIFNRWGQQVYASYDIENGWDGKPRTSDKVSPPGVYLYKIEVTDDRGFVQRYEGQVNLIK